MGNWRFGAFPKLPYSTMQQLNLDWILDRIRRFLPDTGTRGQVLTRTKDGAAWVDPEAASGAVSSVNGKTGAVILTASDVGAMPDSYTAPVSSVNGQIGNVTLGAADVGALPESYVPPAAPVQSVNGQTGAVQLAIPDSTSDLTNDSGFITAAQAAAAAPVQSVNGQTGAVVLDASDVGALPDTYTAPVTSVNGMTGDVVVSGGGDKIHTAFLSKSVTFPSQAQGGYVLFGSKNTFSIPATATIISAVIVGFSGFGPGYGGIGVALSADGNSVYLLSVNSGTGTFGVRLSYIE